MKARKRILTSHGIKVVSLSNNTLLADNEDGTYTNVTDYTVPQLYKFLGY